MSIKRYQPIYIIEPPADSKSVSDRLHLAVLRGKCATVTKLLESGVPVEVPNTSGLTPLFCAAFQGRTDIAVILLKFGGDPNRRCSILSCTPVHASCWSGNTQLIKSLLVAGGDLRLHDQQNRSPRDWAMLQPESEIRLSTLSLIESFRQMAMKQTGYDYHDVGLSEINSNSLPRSQSPFKLPPKLRATLTAMGLVCSENSEYIGPLGNVQGTGFGKIIYGRGESAAAFWPVPLIEESDISDPDRDLSGVEANLNGLLPRPISFRTGAATEMVSRRWHQTPVSVRRMRENESPDLLFEELHSMSRLRHPGLLLLLGVCATQHWESVQLVYEPVYHGSLYHRIHIMGNSIPLLKRLLILQQICDALLFLHSRGLLHCSVSSHAVLLVSLSRPKLGCLETLIEETDSSKRVYRKVPGSHWEELMPWLSPECARGDHLRKSSDVYSFCVLVWETCMEQEPWGKYDTRKIARMWQQSDYAKPSMLPIDNTIPTHIANFLKLGLQPELSERREIDLQEIYLMLRLQTASISQNQQQEERQNNAHCKPNCNQGLHYKNTVQVPDAASTELQTNISKHDWEAVKRRMKRMRNPHPPSPPAPPLPTREVDTELDAPGNPLDECIDTTVLNETAANENFEIENEQNVTLHLESDLAPRRYDDEGSDGGIPVFTPQIVKHPRVPNSDCAIKPASHTTERHAGTCILYRQDKFFSTFCSPVNDQHTEARRLNRGQSYATLSEEVRSSVAQPSKQHNDLDDFSKWTDKQSKHNESVLDHSGRPSFTSTPRHDEFGNSLLASSSRLEEKHFVRVPGDPPAKPKRSLKFNMSQPEAISSSFRIPLPKTDIVAALSAHFDKRKSKPQSILKFRSKNNQAPIQNVADAFGQENCISQGVQCDNFAECELNN